MPGGRARCRRTATGPRARCSRTRTRSRRCRTSPSRPPGAPGATEPDRRATATCPSSSLPRPARPRRPRLSRRSRHVRSSSAQDDLRPAHLRILPDPRADPARHLRRRRAARRSVSSARSPDTGCGAGCGASGSPRVDHKKIGIMYIILGIIMLLRGFADALMMRAQQAIAFGGSEGYLQRAPLRSDLHRARDDHDLLRGDPAGRRASINFVMPLQIGARDVAFPFLNNLSFWLTVAGALLVMISLFVGEFSPRRLAQLRAGREPAEQPGHRARLLPLGAPDSRHRHDAVGDQHGRRRSSRCARRA